MDAITEVRKLAGIIEASKDVVNFPELLQHVRAAKRKMRGLRMVQVEGMPGIMGPKKSVDLFIQAMKDAGLHPKVYTDRRTRRPMVVTKRSPW